MRWSFASDWVKLRVRTMAWSRLLMEWCHGSIKCLWVAQIVSGGKRASLRWATVGTRIMEAPWRQCTKPHRLCCHGICDQTWHQTASPATLQPRCHSFRLLPLPPTEKGHERTAPRLGPGHSRGPNEAAEEHSSFCVPGSLQWSAELMETLCWCTSGIFWKLSSWCVKIVNKVFF